MTREQRIKIFSHDLFMRFKNLGIPDKKAQDAAIVCILAMCDQYLKITKDPPDKMAEKQADFGQLIKDLNDYFAGRNYVEVPIEEIAALKNCKKDQILITY
jgi:hypothetical protein